MQYTAWLRWALITGLCLTLFTVFIVADGIHFPLNMFFPYITGKNFTLRILIEILSVLYVLLAIREPKYRPRSSLLMWALGLFVLWMAVATIFSVDPVKSFWSNFERMDGYITLLHMFALFIIAGAVLTAENWWKKLFQVSVAASYIMSVYGLMQVFHIFGLQPSSQSGPRADTTFGNAIYLAVYMLFQIFITLYLLYDERKSKTAWWLYGIALVLQTATLLFTETRGALIGVIGGLILAGLYIAFFGKGPQSKKIRMWALIGMALIVLIVAVFIGVRNTSFVQNSPTLERYASLSLTDDTAQARLTIWAEAWQGFKQSPRTVFLGWGQENFNFVFNKYYNPTMYAQEQWFDRAHNQFIDWAIDGGLPAFLLYVATFAFAVWIVWKSDLDVPEQAILMGLLAAYAFNNMTVFDNMGSYLYFYLILAFIHGLSRKGPPGWMFMSKPLGDKAVAVAAPVLLVLLVWGGWYLNGPGIARAQTLITALSTQDPNTGAAIDPSVNIAAFQQALSYGPYLGYQETIEQLFQFSSNTIAPSTSLSPAVKQQAFTLTEDAGNALLAQRPHDARPELFYGVFLDQFDQEPQALTYLQEALADSPKKQQILFEIGSTYLAEGDVKDALPPFQEAYMLDTSYTEAAAEYAAALYYAGQNSAADAILIQSFGTVDVNNDTVMQAYFDTKQYARLSAIYAQNLQTDPTDVQSLVGQAITTYFVNGNKQQAITELNQAAAANPSLATEIQSFVSQIEAGTLKP